VERALEREHGADRPAFEARAVEGSPRLAARVWQLVELDGVDLRRELGQGAPHARERDAALVRIDDEVLSIGDAAADPA